MGIYPTIVAIWADLTAIVIGVTTGLIWLDTKPNRVWLALMFFGCFLEVAWGANFQVDMKNGYYVYLWDHTLDDKVFGTVFRTIHYIDDKPAKLRLELVRMAGVFFWAFLTRYGIPALQRFRRGSK